MIKKKGFNIVVCARKEKYIHMSHEELKKDFDVTDDSPEVLGIFLDEKTAKKSCKEWNKFFDEGSIPTFLEARILSNTITTDIRVIWHPPGSIKKEIRCYGIRRKDNFKGKKTCQEIMRVILKEHW